MSTNIDNIKMYGTQAERICEVELEPFENDVKMYGTQAENKAGLFAFQFENDVKMYGTQASPISVLVLEYK